jgi:membrane protease YdiL (CAAX protease family)
VQAQSGAGAVKTKHDKNRGGMETVGGDAGVLLPVLVEGESSLAAREPLPVPAGRRLPIAPWWHTSLLVALIVGTSAYGVSGRLRSRGTAVTAIPHYWFYSLTILWEWALAGIAYWGIKMRRVPLRRLLGERRSGAKAWYADFKWALVIWIIFLPVVGVIHAVLSHVEDNMFVARQHENWSGAPRNAVSGGSKADKREPPRHTQSEIVRKRIARLAPSTGGEMLLWIALSISAGICEEFIFRGYLQQQFASLNGRLWEGVVCSAIIFGGAHAYEGVAGMISIALLGAVFSMLAVRRHGLRSSMMRHSWYDSFAGGVLLLLKHGHRI